MDITDNDYKELIGYMGWLSAIKKYNNSPIYIDFNELKKDFLIQNKIVGGPNFTDDNIKSMINQLCKRNLLEFKKENDIVFLKLVL